MSNFCISNPDVGPMENLHQPFVVTLLQSKLTDRWPIAATQIWFQDLCNKSKIYALSELQMGEI